VTGFTPPNWLPFAEVRDQLGAERLGALLASGSVRALYLDAWGTEKYLEATDWRRSTAKEVMSRGVAFSRRRVTNPECWEPDRRWVEETWPLFILAESLPAEHARPSIANDTRPAWWLAEGQSVASWVRSKPVLEEAERRIREKGRTVTQSQKADFLVDMAAEAGRTTRADSVIRSLQRARGG
jgi:hypothetical protein